jgi:Kunitz/Bovine pancreatic trypsin inhibitor domain
VSNQVTLISISMKKYIAFFLLMMAFGCHDKEKVTPTKCSLEPDSGPCFASIRRYYYDRQDKQCKEFIWGGCGGVVPFETLEECKACEANHEKPWLR